jgi:hypothetical protein
MKEGWLLRDGEVLAAADVAGHGLEGTRGLLGRRDYDRAMHFPRTRSIHTAGMRFALDVAFLDRDLVVLAVARVPPWRVALPRRGTRSILEASAGSFERWGLRVGDHLEIRETA